MSERVSRLKAWELEHKRRSEAVPVDFAENPSDWSGVDHILQSRRSMLDLIWESEVPGSRAPESMVVGMIQAWHNRGYDVSEAERLLPAAWEARSKRDYGTLEKLTGRIQKALRNAPVDPENPYWKFACPETWEEIEAAFPVKRSGAGAVGSDSRSGSGTGRVWDRELLGSSRPCHIPDLEERIHGGWLGQIVGGAYGTALEGYTGEALRRTYGDRLDFYVKEPETYNDDITYELAFLAAADEKGRDLGSDDIADKWLQLIPFGWSAEYFALENLRRGIYPPESGRSGNFFCEWIGAQMRTMVCGLVAPGDPLRAARYAYLDSVVSHEKNGVYGGIHSAVLTSLAFVVHDTRELLVLSRNYVPDGTQFAALLDEVMESAANHTDHLSSWAKIEQRLKTYNWIHTYPNMAAVVHALWYCGNSFDRALRILADCGMDVDCNAGEAGCAIGVMFPRAIGERWTRPLGNELRTYVSGYEKLAITDLAAWTYRVSGRLR